MLKSADFVFCYIHKKNTCKILGCWVMFTLLTTASHIVLGRWQSGRMHWSWKPAKCELPWVRIPLSPPDKELFVFRRVFLYLKFRVRTHASLFFVACATGVRIPLSPPDKELFVFRRVFFMPKIQSCEPTKFYPDSFLAFLTLMAGLMGSGCWAVIKARFWANCTVSCKT